MTIRVVAPADGSGSVTVSWDLDPVLLQEGTILDVLPGSALESAIGVANLVTMGTQQQANAQNGCGGTGWVAN
jgi:hypothetical protein